MSDFNLAEYDSFCKVIHETKLLFDDLLELENKKIDAISVNDVDLLDQYMNEENVFLMQMRGLDFKREKMQEQLGAKGLTFREIIDKFDGLEKDNLNNLYDGLSVKSQELKDAIGSVKRLIDMHLYSISELLDKLEGKEGIYNKDGEKPPAEPPARFTPTKA